MNPVPKLIAKRLALGFFSLWFVSLGVFFAIEALPGDAAEAILGQSAMPETVEALRREMGLERPAIERYADWMGSLARGDLGRSIATGRDVSDLIAWRLSNTLFLAVTAALISVPLAIGLGLGTALWRNSLFDRASNIATLTSISLPEFFVGYVLIFIFSVKLALLPSLSSIAPDMGFAERLFRTILPAFTLVLVVVAHMMRMTRAAVINLLAQPYIEMARLKGAGNARVILWHALPNAIAPIVTVIALNLAYLVTGVVVVEVVFVYPGLGQSLVDSVSTRDLPVVQAACLIFAAAYILLNLTADLVAILSNPRLLHPRS
ncbi:ABC transporter permease [Oricola sp.]|uniref:ABC transporter permease n=1 Tax=Oricola sp. TaxID=1979950 RepID=UPI0025D3CF0C|nr:ABC transporter permease [Oricola sp.]MCI5076889.1 ABC transporter permease [Oricola sp.]